MASFSVAFQTDKPLSDYGPLARRCEELGFDAVTVYNDLMFQPAWLPLLEIARATEHVRIGTAAVNPFLTHPVHIAAQAALIEEASNGRSYLGIARGSWLDLVGIQAVRPVKVLREALELIQHLLAGKAVPYVGEIFSLTAADSFRWRLPQREIPVLLGSWGYQTIRACLPLIREVKLGGTANPAVVRRVRSWLDGEPGGRKVDLVVGAVSVVDEDSVRARELARCEAALYLPVIARLDPDLTVEEELLRRIERAVARRDAEAAGRLVPDQQLDKLALAGSPGQVVKQCQALLEAGADRIEFGTPHGRDEKSGLDLLGRQVLTRLRSGGRR